MKAIVQRVMSASVSVDGNVVGSIKNGFLIYLCVLNGDTEKDSDWIVNKIHKMRVFSDEKGKMNISIEEKTSLGLDYGILYISQFTLSSNMKRGNRPSFNESMEPNVSREIFDSIVSRSKARLGFNHIQCGVFGADMKVNSVNDGPVTFILDSRI